jgi:hypothetical protein
MHPRTTELLDHLDAWRAELRGAVEAVPPALRERRPTPESWTVAEVVEHLAVVQEGIAGLVAHLIAKHRAALPPEEGTAPVVPTLDVRRVLDRRRRIEARENVRPSGTLDAAAAWERLERGTPALRDAVRAGDGLAIGALAANHPALGRLDLYQWIVFVGAHEGRHAAQIREIGAALARTPRAT